MILEGLVYPSEVEDEGLLVEEAEGVEIYQGIEVGMMEHLLRKQVAVRYLLNDLWMELVALKNKFNHVSS